MPPRKTYKAATAPVFTAVLMVAMTWNDIKSIVPNAAFFGVLALVGAFAKTLMEVDSDTSSKVIRVAILKGISAMILGSVLPTFAVMLGAPLIACGLLAFLIGLCFEVVIPAIREGLIERLRKLLKGI